MKMGARRYDYKKKRTASEMFVIYTITDGKVMQVQCVCVCLATTKSFTLLLSDQRTFFLSLKGSILVLLVPVQLQARL